MTRRHIREKELDKLEMRIKELKTFLNTSNHTLEELLASDKCRLNKELLVLLGGMDRNTDPKLWPLFNKYGQIPVHDVPYEENLKDYRRKCTNDASNAGNQSVKLEPAADSIVILDFASIVNHDTVNRTCTIYLYTAGGNLVAKLVTGSIAANEMLSYELGYSTDALYKKLVLTDAFELLLTAEAIAVSEDADFFMLYQVVGDNPTITETGPTGSTWSDVS